MTAHDCPQCGRDVRVSLEQVAVEIAAKDARITLLEALLATAEKAEDAKAEHIRDLEAELHALKNPSDGRCMEIGALRRQTQALEADLAVYKRLSGEASLHQEYCKLVEDNDALEAECREYREALEKLSKGNRSPGVLEIARKALSAGRKV